MQSNPYGREGFVSVNGIVFHHVAAGEGPLILLLHGFPEFWYGWRRQIRPLAGAGFRVVVPDLRGYGGTEKPKATCAYRLEALVADTAGLIEAFSAEGAVVVGHDWGGIIGWYAAMRHPALVRKLVVLNAPHPAVFVRELRGLSSQWLRSWYAGVFQLPWLPEASLRANGFALLRRIVRAGAAGSEEEADAYLRAFRQPGALTAAINYYRAALRCGRPDVEPVLVPTLVIWGVRDRMLVPALAEGLEPWVPDLRVERIEASHWLQHEYPETIASLIARFARERSVHRP